MDDERCNEQELAEMEAEYHWYQSQLPEHKRDGYAERMYEMADLRRKEQRENQP